MEELLNKIIEMWWKVFWVEPEWRKVILTKRLDGRIHISYFNETIWRTWWSDFSLRELVSKESWLWQFVCKNNLNYSEDDSIYNVWLKHYAEDDHESPYTYASPVWYIIESALCNEEDLDKFLLDNIKI